MTPNYKLVTYPRLSTGDKPKKPILSRWEAMPLRANRKDLSP